MSIQEQLLLEQLFLLKKSELGRYILNGTDPYTMDEFRRRVPMTTYVDYCPALLEKREDILPAKPKLWIQTNGRSGLYPHKWIPYTEKFWAEAGLNFDAIAIFGSCKDRGDIAFGDNFKLLYAMGQPPYLTGNIAHKIEEELGFEFLPPLSESDEMSFEERVEKGSFNAGEGKAAGKASKRPKQYTLPGFFSP